MIRRIENNSLPDVSFFVVMKFCATWRSYAALRMPSKLKGYGLVPLRDVSIKWHYLCGKLWAVFEKTKGNLPVQKK